jgi:uncharacterized membrane protein
MVAQHAAVAIRILSGLATGLAWLCYFRDLQFGDVPKVAPAAKLSVVAMLLATLFCAPAFRSRKNLLDIAAGAHYDLDGTF